MANFLLFEKALLRIGAQSGTNTVFLSVMRSSMSYGQGLYLVEMHNYQCRNPQCDHSARFEEVSLPLLRVQRFPVMCWKEVGGMRLICRL